VVGQVPGHLLSERLLGALRASQSHAIEFQRAKPEKQPVDAMEVRGVSARFDVPLLFFSTTENGRDRGSLGERLE
jgi:hypothetical protein